MANTQLPAEVEQKIFSTLLNHSLANRTTASKELAELFSTEYATKMQQLQQDYDAIKLKYDNILATESGHESQTENVWQSGYAAGHDEGYKKALKGTENITADWQTLQSKIATLEQSCNEKNMVITELNNTGTNLRTRCAKQQAALSVVQKWQLPSTGQFWDDDKTQPMSYGACYGSNGERDFMRNVANEAISEGEGEKDGGNG
jgi:hypothetical protein